MGFRFYRRIKILPGIRLNVGKRGISTSIGVRGAHITVGHGKVRESVGIPGTGISYTATQGTHHQAAADAPGHERAPVAPEALPVPEVLPAGKAWRGWLWIVLLVGLLAYFARQAMS
jgi:hypothetical protein